MRGTTLIFHSLDPETLERIDDLSSLSLDFLDLHSLPYIDDDIDKYSLSGVSLNSQPDTSPSRSRTSSMSLSSSGDESLSFHTIATIAKAHVTTANNEIITKTAPTADSSQTQNQRGKYEPTRTTTQTNQSHSHDRNNNVNKVNPQKRANLSPVLRQLENCSSPPLNKSNYEIENEPAVISSITKSGDCIRSHNREGSQSQSQSPNTVMNKMNHVFHRDGDERGMKGRAAFSAVVGSRLPLSRLSVTKNIATITKEASSEKERSGHLQEAASLNQNNSHFKGFGRFLFGHREENNRFDIYNLPPQLKEELRHIYVY